MPRTLWTRAPHGGVYRLELDHDRSNDRIHAVLTAYHADVRSCRGIRGLAIPDWAVGTDPESDPHGYERGPPCAFDGVDPPCPDDVFGE